MRRSEHPDDPDDRPSTVASLPQELPPPPAGPALTAALTTLTPVRTRVPARAFWLLLAVAGLTVGLALLQFGVRRDLAALPLAWVVVLGGLWAAAGPWLLARAVLPQPGQVLPDATRAGRSAVAVAAGLVLLGLLATVDAAGVTRVPTTFWGGWWHCTKFALRITLPVLLAAAVLLRHLHPMGSGKIAGALGAAGGAVAGALLHFICPLGGGAHVGLAHGGAAVVGGVIGALLLSRLLR